MRIDVHAINMPLPAELKVYAEQRAWLAVQRWPRRAVWVGVWLMDHQVPAGEVLDLDEAAERPRFSCMIDVWLRGVGTLTVRHYDHSPRSALDIAAARLQRAIATRVRRLVHRRRGLPSRSRARASRGPSRHEPIGAAPRLAIVIQRSGLPMQRWAMPWLRQRYGIEQVSWLSLPVRLWRAAAEDEGLAEALRDRLALSLLCWPEVVVVVGGGGAADDADARRLEQNHVRRIVQRLEDWRLPVPTVGVWVEPGDAGGCPAPRDLNPEQPAAAPAAQAPGIEHRSAGIPLQTAVQRRWDKEVVSCG